MHLITHCCQQRMNSPAAQVKAVLHIQHVAYCKQSSFRQPLQREGCPVDAENSGLGELLALEWLGLEWLGLLVLLVPPTCGNTTCGRHGISSSAACMFCTPGAAVAAAVVLPHNITGQEVQLV
jgi:hypothetical protein